MSGLSSSGARRNVDGYKWIRNPCPSCASPAQVFYQQPKNGSLMINELAQPKACTPCSYTPPYWGVEHDPGGEGDTFINADWWVPDLEQHASYGQLQISRHPGGGIQKICLTASPCWEPPHLDVLKPSAVRGPVLWGRERKSGRLLTLLGIHVQHTNYSVQFVLLGRHIKGFDAKIANQVTGVSDSLFPWQASCISQDGGARDKSSGTRWTISMEAGEFWKADLASEELKIRGAFEPWTRATATQVILKKRGFLTVQYKSSVTLEELLDEADCMAGFIAICLGQAFRFDSWQIGSPGAPLHLFIAEETPAPLPRSSYVLMKLSDTESLTETYRSYRRWFHSNRSLAYAVTNQLALPSVLTDCEVFSRMALVEGLARPVVKKGMSLAHQLLSVVDQWPGAKSAVRAAFSSYSTERLSPAFLELLMEQGIRVKDSHVSDELPGDMDMSNAIARQEIQDILCDCLDWQDSLEGFLKGKVLLLDKHLGDGPAQSFNWDMEWKRCALKALTDSEDSSAFSPLLKHSQKWRTKKCIPDDVSLRSPEERAAASRSLTLEVREWLHKRIREQLAPITTRLTAQRTVPLDPEILCRAFESEITDRARQDLALHEFLTSLADHRNAIGHFTYEKKGSAAPRGLEFALNFNVAYTLILVLVLGQAKFPPAAWERLPALARWHRPR